MIFHFTKLLISFNFCLKMFFIDNFEDIRVIESGITLLNGAFSAAPPSTSEASILGGEFLRSPQFPHPRPQLNIHQIQKLLRHPVSWQALPRSPQSLI